MSILGFARTIVSHLLLTMVTLLSSLAVAGAGAAGQPNVLFIAADDLRTISAVLATRQVHSPQSRRPGGPRPAVHACLLPAGAVQSVAGLADDRPPPGHAEIWDLPTHFRDVSAGRGHAAAALHEARLLHAEHRQDLSQLAAGASGRPRFLERAGRDALRHPRFGQAASRGRAAAESRQSIRKCECRDVPDDAYFDGRIAALAIAALRERKAAGQPFFLAVGFWKPHSPFNAPKKYWDLYDRAKLAAAGEPRMA